MFYNGRKGSKIDVLVSKTFERLNRSQKYFELFYARDEKLKKS